MSSNQFTEIVTCQTCGDDHKYTGTNTCKTCEEIQHRSTKYPDSRPFPVQGTYDGKENPSSIPWWLAEIAYQEYSRRFGTQQSLTRLAQRGGFGRAELLMLLRKKERP